LSKTSIIGICGPSCSGKGAVTEYIAARNHQVIRICQDNFFKIKSPVRTDDGRNYNLEVPEALMMDKLICTISSLKKGTGFKVPYAGWTEKFNVEINEHDLKLRPIIIVDGFLLFVSNTLTNLFDLKLFISVSELNMLYRRLNREGNIDRIHYIYNTVIPRSLKYKDLQIDNSGGNIVDGNKTKIEVIKEVTDCMNHNLVDNNLAIQVDNPPWKVLFGDLITDNCWHPVDYDNLKDWIKTPEKLALLEKGREFPGNNFAYRKSRSVSNEYEVRLNDGCSIFRYENKATIGLGQS